MEPTPVQSEHDQDFRSDPQPRPIAEEPYLDIENFQRLVGNPFLGLFALVAWLLAVRWLFLGGRFPFWLPAWLFLLATVAGLPFLFQYHCRDCGATGALHRWRSHACEAVNERRRLGEPRRLRGPSPVLQVVVWLYLLLLIAIFWTAWR